ncbi:hypothetical protein [Anaerococcus rubeinfantis]|uniref:hypothetical protein n=1 Tax=Anaerococcus rubeinfantis TaxID=1720199 RepID=UPI00073F2C8E|nr:hypothetical protein [Anaerococcus rubeinfantis]
MYYFISLNNQKVDESVFEIDYKETDYEEKYIIWENRILYPSQMNFWNCIESIEIIDDLKQIEGQLEIEGIE